MIKKSIGAKMQKLCDIMRADAKKSIAILLVVSLFILSIPIAAIPSVSADSLVSGSDAVIEEKAETKSTTASSSDVASSTDIAVTNPAFSASKTVDGVRIAVSAPAGVFPAGVELSVAKVSTAVQDKVDDLIGEADSSFTFDIKILLDGVEIQPNTAHGSVEVNFSLDVPEAADVEVYHIDDGITVAETLNPTVNSDSVTVETGSFSVFVVKFEFKSYYGTYTYSMDGADTITLSELAYLIRLDPIYNEFFYTDGLHEICLDRVTNIVSSDPTKLSLTPIDGGDWEIKVVSPYTETDVTITIDYSYMNGSYEMTGTRTIKVLCPDISLPASGTAGGAEWEIDENGAMRIYKGDGDGILESYAWDDYRDLITSVVVSEGVSAPEYAGNLFAGLRNCKTMDLRGLDVSNATNMSCMFEGCESMENYDITGWDTSKVTNMYGMFRKARFADFDLASLDTSNVTGMNAMFRLSKDESLDLSGVDVSKVEDVQCMFMYSSAETINFDGWDTRNFIHMTQMFEGANIKTIDLSSFELKNAEHMVNFLHDCDNLVSFDSSTWTKFKPQKENFWFTDLLSECDRLEYADLSGFGGYAITSESAAYMFGNCVSLKKVNLNGAFNLTNAQEYKVNSWFWNCISLEELDLSSLGTISTSSLSSMLINCQSLKKLVVPNAPVWYDYTIRNGISLDTIVIGGGMVFEDDITLENVRENCFPTYADSTSTDDYLTGERVPHSINKNGAGANAFFTEMNGNDMTVYYLPKEGETTQKVTIEKDGVTTVVDLIENPEFYVIEDVTPDTIITIKFGPRVDITFKDSTDESVIDTVNIAVGDEIIAPEAPTHEGVEFLRWATEKNGETEADLSAAKEDMTVWAVYGVPFKPTVTVTSTGLGTATPDGETVVEKGDDLDITITPENAARVTFEVTVNGTKVDNSTLTASGSAKILSLTDIQEDTAVNVVFTAEPITGAPSVEFEKASKTFDIDETIKFKAIGFWADNTTDFIKGDERYVPVEWHHADPSGDWAGKTAPTDDYSASFSRDKAGKYTLKVEFQKYVYNGSAWAEDEIVTVEADYVVKSASGGSSDTPKTGDSIIGIALASNLMLVAAKAAEVLYKKKNEGEEA